MEAPLDPLEADDGATPLTAEECDGLIPGHVTQRHELNELEQAGVLAADVRIFQRIPRDVMNERFIEGLHANMFGDVWRWAGLYRTTERNMGVDPVAIRPALRQLMDDARFWVANTTYPPDELAVRVHHRLVSLALRGSEWVKTGG